MGDEASQAWSCINTVGPDALDAPYPDEIGERYVYDSNVIHYGEIAVGDTLLIRDRQLIWGLGTVEQIDREPWDKPMTRCPGCRSTDIARRTTKLPPLRCNDCKHVFEAPFRDITPVTRYTAHYGPTWRPLPARVSIQVLDSDVYAQKDRQNAIRRIDAHHAVDLIGSVCPVGVETALEDYLHRLALPAPGGHIDVQARQRRGQSQYRSQLVDRFGEMCAVTGPQPPDILDAAHLRSFATHAVHDAAAGLLLRADVHRMFDRLLLTFNRRTWRTEVAPALLARYPHLAVLHGQEMRVPQQRRPDPDVVGAHSVAAHERWNAWARAVV